MRDLNLCRALDVSWRELQEMPEELVDVWQALIQGEQIGHKTRNG